MLLSRSMTQSNLATLTRLRMKASSTLCAVTFVATLTLILTLLCSPTRVQAAPPRHAKTAEDLIIENPVREYKKFRKRLIEYGPNASFPEFKPTIDEIVRELVSPDLQKTLLEHPILQMEHTEVLTYLTHINLSFTYDNRSQYPYINSYEGPFPYRPTLEAIEASLRFFDKVERLTNPNVVPLYHFDRYAYHKHALMGDLENIVFPTMRNLGFSDLIRIRSVPIGFVGVSTKTLRVDRYWQSPLDFWYHDINHVRRLAAYLKLKAQIAKANTPTKRLKLYQELDQFITSTILPNIVKLPAGATEEQIAVRRLTRLIIFEIFHESAVAPDVPSIVTDLLRGPDVKTPYEIMQIERIGQNTSDIESMRTAVGNIQSGAKTISEANHDNRTVTIRYYHDRDLGLLANVYNKLIYGYYDEPEAPNEFIAPRAFRKSEYVVKATLGILSFLGVDTTQFKFEELRKLVLSRDGKPELFNYEALQEHEAEVEKPKHIATEPLTAKEAIRQIRAIGKHIHTLFGYSRMEYEDKPAMLRQVREDLLKLDPKTTIINIGATEEGIGAAYEIAKELGFETMGVVSMQALSYSGRFSDFVDRIFIMNDNLWGGYMPGSKTKLTPTTQTYIETMSSMKAYGGGLNTSVPLKEAVKRGIPVEYQPFDMNHAVADADIAAKKAAGRALNYEGYLGEAARMWQALQSRPRSSVKSCEALFARKH